jgi:small multidrug resistance pump
MTNAALWKPSIMETQMTYAFLFTAIVLEVIGTSALKASEQFTRLLPILIMVICYGASFFFLSLVLRTLPVGIAYAIWSGLGIVLISMVGVIWFKQTLDLPALVGLGLIVAGVVVVNLFSKSVGH